MNVVVRPAAAADIEDAFRWYQAQREGLGAEFVAALRDTMDLVLVHPEGFPIIHRDTRRVLLRNRFPYGLFYRTQGSTIIVVACMHAKRSPRRWRSRK
jgi:plasmid stabilization system protein ParE